VALLPYHDHPLFARLLQILNLSNPKWHFLKEAQKNGSVVARNTLVTRCQTDKHFLDFVGTVAEKSAQASLKPTHNKAAVSFFASTIMQTLLRAKTIDDNFFLSIAPHILNGLRNSRCPEYQMASRLILCQLSRTTPLKAEPLHSFLTSIVKYTTAESPPQHLSKTILALISLCQVMTLITRYLLS